MQLSQQFRHTGEDRILPPAFAVVAGAIIARQRRAFLFGALRQQLRGPLLYRRSDKAIEGDHDRAALRSSSTARRQSRIPGFESVRVPSRSKITAGNFKGIPSVSQERTWIKRMRGFHSPRPHAQHPRRTGPGSLPSARCFKQEPSSPLRFVDPNLNQAGRGVVVCL